MSKENLLAAGKKWERGMRHQPYVEPLNNCIKNALMLYSALREEDEQLGRDCLVSLAQNAFDEISRFPFADVRFKGFKAHYDVAMELGDDDITGILGIMIADQEKEFLFEQNILFILTAAEKFARHSQEASQYVRGKITLEAAEATGGYRAALMRLL